MSNRYIKIAQAVWAGIETLWKRRKQKKIARQLAKVQKAKARALKEFHSREAHEQKIIDIQKTLNEPLSDELKDMEVLGI